MARVTHWAVAGALTTFGVLGILSIGLPFLVAGVAFAVWLAGAFGTHDAYGLAFGSAAVLAALGALGQPEPLAFFGPAALFAACGVAACFSSHARERQL